MECFVCSKTYLATDIAFLILNYYNNNFLRKKKLLNTPRKAPTAPTFIVTPSIIIASNVVSPFSSGLPP